MERKVGIRKLLITTDSNDPVILDSGLSGKGVPVFESAEDVAAFCKERGDRFFEALPVKGLDPSARQEMPAEAFVARVLNEEFVSGDFEQPPYSLLLGNGEQMRTEVAVEIDPHHPLHGLRFSFVEIQPSAERAADWHAGAAHYRVALSNPDVPGVRLAAPFSKGAALDWGVSKGEVLQCFGMDICGIRNAQDTDDWIREYGGGDPGEMSKKQYNKLAGDFRKIEQQAEKFDRLIPSAEVFDYLVYRFEREPVMACENSPVLPATIELGVPNSAKSRSMAVVIDLESGVLLLPDRANEPAFKVAEEICSVRVFGIDASFELECLSNSENLACRIKDIDGLVGKLKPDCPRP